MSRCYAHLSLEASSFPHVLCSSHRLFSSLNTSHSHQAWGPWTSSFLQLTPHPAHNALRRSVQTTCPGVSPLWLSILTVCKEEFIIYLCDYLISTCLPSQPINWVLFTIVSRALITLGSTRKALDKYLLSRWRNQKARTLLQCLTWHSATWQTCCSFTRGTFCCLKRTGKL